MEQRLARQAHNLEVVGSIPTGATPYSNSTPADGGVFMRLGFSGFLLGLPPLGLGLVMCNRGACAGDFSLSVLPVFPVPA